MLGEICFQLLWVNLFEATPRCVWLKVSFFLQALLPFSDGRYCYLKYLACFFQCMTFLAVLYRALPVFYRVTHSSRLLFYSLSRILSYVLQVFKCFYYTSQDFRVHL